MAPELTSGRALPIESKMTVSKPVTLNLVSSSPSSIAASRPGAANSSDVLVGNGHLAAADAGADVGHAVVVADGLVLVVWIAFAGLGGLITGGCFGGRAVWNRLKPETAEATEETTAAEEILDDLAESEEEIVIEAPVICRLLKPYL